MSEHPVDPCDEWPKRETIAGHEWRWRWTVFGARLPIAGTEHHCGEPQVFARERRTTSKPHLDRCPAWQMDAGQACGKGRRIVRDDEIARIQKLRQVRARGVRNRAVLAYDEQACVPVARTLPVRQSSRPRGPERTGTAVLDRRPTQRLSA